MNKSIDSFFQEHKNIHTKQKIYALQIPILEVQANTWLAKQTLYPKFYWANRDHSEELASLGSVHTLRPAPSCDIKNVYNKIRKVVNNNADTFFCGGTAFNSHKHLPPDWKSFGAFYYFVPRFALKKTKEEMLLVIFLRKEELNDSFAHHLKSDLARMFPSATSQTKVTHEINELGNYSIIHSQNIPSQEVWCQQIHLIQEGIKAKQQQKVVLARESRLQLSENLIPEQLLPILQEASNTFDFYLQINSQAAFLGRSPELLFERSFRNLYSEAVAASLAVEEGVNDLHLEQFMQDKKSKAEQGYVIDFLTKKFSFLCQSSNPPTALTTLAHPGLRHLFSSISGQLKTTIKDVDIIRALHPTPAVGGFPKRKIMKRLASLESFNRGWYSAPLGIISKHRTIMAVGIRSMLLNKKNVHLYAGAGIISESVARLEWQELEHKIRNFKDIFYE